MPFKSKNQEKIYKSINQFKFILPEEKIEIDESDKDKDYDPINDLFFDESSINDELLVEMIDLVLHDSCLRNLSVYSYALLKKFGINTLEIRKVFLNIGLQKEQNCRENLIKFHKSEFELHCGGTFNEIKLI